MKRLILVSLLGATLSVSTFASPITPEQALSRLKSSTSHSLKLRGTQTADFRFAYGNDQWYAFDNPRGGWVIIPGDDVAMPLLGYADSGEFDYDNLPEAMKWWLEQYALEIDAAQKGGVETAAVAGGANSHDAISPLLKTNWDQNSPFNLLTPVVDGVQSPSGCVATSQAQFMKYFNYPSKGTGNLSYVMNGTTLSMNLDEVVFEWDKMLDVYGADATEEQKEAVAKLMQACGYAVKSDYKAYETSASVYLWYSSLVQNFGYAPSSRLISRIYFNNEDWDNAVYQSLAHGEPVLYSGLGSSGGHAFVCDGYSGDGYYHFNWGWAGLSNGYFLLSALNPTALGTGGGAGGFNSGQIALVDCRPNFEGSVATPQMGLLQQTQLSYSNVSKNLSIIGGGLMNLSATPLSARAGFEIECPDGTVLYAGETNSPLEFDVSFILTTYARKVPVTLEDGTYKVRPVFGIEQDGTTEWYHAQVPVDMNPYWTLTMAGGKGTLENNTANSDIVVTDFKPTTEIYSSTQFKVGANIQNNGEREFMSNLYVQIFSKEGSLVMTGTANPVDLMPGQTDYFEFTVEPRNLIVGEMAISLSVDKNGEIKEITPRIPVTVHPFCTEVEIKATEFYVENADNVNPENINLHIAMTCVKGNYANPVRFWIRLASVTTGTWGQMLQTSWVYLSEGESTSFVYTFEYPKGVAGETYNLLSNYIIPESQSWFGQCQFTIGATDGVEAVEDDSDAPARYYNLQGMEVAAPVKGLYIKVKGGKSEKVFF